MSVRFGSQNIKKGIVHFLVGKVLSSVAGFIALILTVRGLSITEFAAYSILIALVEYVTALSGFGLTHIVLRYIPELYGREYDYAFKKFVSRSLYCRLASLIVLAVLAYLFSDRLSALLGDQVPKQAFEAFLLVATIRTGSFFLSQILDSTLSQGVSQFAFMMAAVTKATLVALLLYIDNAGLINIILVEAVGDSISVLVMFFGVYRVLNASRNVNVPDDDRVWLRDKKKAIIHYAVTGYLQHLMILPYGGHTNRLIGGHFLSIFSMASYGFAQSLYEYCKRYLPAQLLLGVIRPVIISRYAENKDFPAAVRLTEVFFKVNALMVAPILVLSLVSGPELMNFISNGKYGVSAAVVLDVLLILLLLETARMQLEVLVQAVERYKDLLLANVFLSCSILPSFYLFNYFDAWIMPALNIIGLVLANVIVLQKLKSDGFIYKHDWHSSFRIAIATTVTLVTTLAVRELLNDNWFVSCIVVSGIYPAAVYLFCKNNIIEMWSFFRSAK